MMAARSPAPGAFGGPLMWALVVALGYYVSGRLGVMLAIPPGYATAVWPASGIALAALLLGGARVAPGVFIGSFCINLATGFDTGSLFTSLLVPAVIAGGATAQAGLGAFLIRRFVGYTNLLTQELDVIHILVLGGPLACTLNASVGVGCLWLTGKIPDSLEFWINWWTWWVGDCIGVFIFAPLVLVWALRPARFWLQRQLFVTVPLAVLFAVVVVLFVFVSHREQQHIESEFREAGENVAASVRKDLDASVNALGALEGFFASSTSVEPYSFEIFALRLMRAMPGSDGLSWNERIEASQRAAFERDMHHLGFPEYRITERGADGKLRPAGERAEYVAIRYIAPTAGNDEAAGFDVLTEAQRRVTLEQARDEGRVVVSGSVELIQSRGRGVLAFMPVYLHGVQPASVDARRRYLRGYAVAVFRFDRLMAAAAQRAREQGMQLRLYDDGAGDRPELLYGRPAPEERGALDTEYRFAFAGRPWRLAFTVTPQTVLAHRSWATWLVLAGGLFLASLVGLLLLLGVGRAARVEALVAARTIELRRLNADLVEEAARRKRLEGEAERRAGELTESNAELQRRAEVNRQLLGSLRRSEGDLRKAATQLQASNRELEQFAYVASHDLKAPLRTIGSFAQLLEKRHAGTLSGEAGEFMKFIQDGIAQMQALIDDLLRLSRVDARRLEPGPVSMQQVVERACRQLGADLDSARARVHVGAMPEVTADANMLVQLIQNLVANAIKFQRPDNTPEIWIEAVSEGEVWHFSVRDNGIGIDPQQLSNIFMVFRRLHGPDQFPGNGIGLAICKKVVNLHGGDIWAESSGEGATFHFTLPRRAEEKAAA